MNVICLDPKAKCVSTIIDNIASRIIPKGYILKDDPTKNYLHGMKVLYSVEFEKPLYLSFMEPQD